MRSTVTSAATAAIIAASASFVTVAVWPADAALFDRMKTQAGSLSATGSVSDISGVGEKAFGEPSAVWALKGGWMINILVVGFDVTGTETVVAVTKSALSRI
ncbi:hypothetical protein ACQEVZ_02470 [Dactylosporangium sp. CA-152071]|uniref:hypothetical protein n=1 Tax=Dactylosporangium sp. CA-152071 TaxID=3239933 RepID=UPI003D92FD94